MTHPLLQLAGVEKTFGKNQVLRGVDIDVARGQSLVIIGGSGSGKSVMLKNALGLMTPDKGTIFFDGEDVTQATGKTREKMRARVTARERRLLAGAEALSVNTADALASFLRTFDGFDGLPVEA